jgi:hypothetical protein
VTGGRTGGISRIFPVTLISKAAGPGFIVFITDIEGEETGPDKLKVIGITFLGDGFGTEKVGAECDFIIPLIEDCIVIFGATSSACVMLFGVSEKMF